MRLMFALSAFFAATGASAQTLPGPGDYDAAAVAALSDTYAYCTTGPGGSAASIAGFLEVMITLEFSDARALDRQVRMADAEAAIARLVADGVVVADDQGVRLPDCALSERQIVARLRLRARMLYDLSEAEQVELLSSAMSAYGCSFTRRDQAAFEDFAFRHVAGLYEIPLPDPLPEGDDRNLTPFLDALGLVFETAGAEMRRQGLMVTDDNVARLQGCTPTGAQPTQETEPEGAYDNDPETVLARLQAMSVADDLAFLVQALEDVGCSVPEERLILFRYHFVRIGLLRMGVDLSETELVTVYYELARNYRTDHPYGDAITYLDRRLSPALAEGLSTGVVGQGALAYSLTAPCQSAGDLSLLERYIPDFN
jgi:hypothetical protein